MSTCDCDDLQEAWNELERLQRPLRDMADRLERGLDLTEGDKRTIIDLAWNDDSAMAKRAAAYHRYMAEAMRPLREAEARAQREAEAWSWAHEAHTEMKA